MNTLQGIVQDKPVSEYKSADGIKNNLISNEFTQKFMISHTQVNVIININQVLIYNLVKALIIIQFIPHQLEILPLFQASLFQITLET